MPSVFSAMFARVPADRVLRFLDERASPWDLLSLIARLPVWPFFRALLAWFARRLPGSRRRLNSPTETRR
jgi:hypothetical protein